MQEPEPSAPDIVSFLRDAGKWTGDELAINSLRVGDRLIVSTMNTKYAFWMHDSMTAELTTNRSDRPSGLVTIRGCVFDDSLLVKPGRLFCGGGMELTLQQGQARYVTTAIRTIELIRVDRSPVL